VRRISLYKVSLLPLFFSVVQLSLLGYYWVRCMATGSSFYCDSFMFGGLFFFLAPALLLLIIAIIGIVVSRTRKTTIDVLAALIIVALAFSIGIAPLLPATFPEVNTYKEWQAAVELKKKEVLEKQQVGCLEYIQERNQWNNENLGVLLPSTSPPTPPFFDESECDRILGF